MAIPQEEQVHAWKTIEAVISEQEYAGQSIDLSSVDDVTLSLANDPAVREYLDFVAEMSDSYSVTRSEQSMNTHVWNAIQDELTMRP